MAIKHRTAAETGYVVAHPNLASGEREDTTITMTVPELELSLEDRGHEIVLPERARERSASK